MKSWAAMKNLTATIGAILLILSVTGCSSMKEEDKGFDYRKGGTQREREGRYGELEPGATTTSLPTLEARRRFPFEVWQYGHDLSGRALRNPQLLAGDEALRGGNLDEALRRYNAAAPELLQPAEREARALRIASVELGADRPERALEVVSRYAAAVAVGAERLPGPFGLVLGYGYARQGNVEQGLAWFSKVYREEAGRGPLADGASRGIALLLRSLPSAEFQPLHQRFADDSVVREAIGRETERRASLPPGSETTETVGAFWNIDKLEPSPATPAAQVGTVSVLGLLPLTGSNKALGENARRGMELAQAGAQGINVALEFEDTMGDAFKAREVGRQALENRRPNVVVGPILAEEALEFAQVARVSKTPVVVLTKKEYFPAGGGVFRLGATIESQVLSLLESAGKFGIKKVAMIYPDDEAARAYAQSFRGHAAGFGITLVADRSYSIHDRQGVVTLSADIEALAPEALFLPTSLREASRVYGAFSETARATVRLLGPASWDDLQELRRSQAIMQRAIFVSPFFRESPRQVVSDFISAYQSRFGVQPDFLAAQGFDAMTLVVAALRRSLADQISFIDAFSRIERYEGLTGFIWVDQYGEVRRRFPVVEFVGGTRRLLPEIPSAPAVAPAAAPAPASGGTFSRM